MMVLMMIVMIMMIVMMMMSIMMMMMSIMMMMVIHSPASSFPTLPASSNNSCRLSSI